MNVFLWAEHFPCFLEVKALASGCDEHQRNLMHGNNGRDHQRQLCVLYFYLNMSKPRRVTNSLSEYSEAVEVNASCTQCFERWAEWSALHILPKVQEVGRCNSRSLFMVSQLVTHSCRFFQDIASKGTLRSWFCFQEKKKERNSFLSLNEKSSC